jgi:hypothetical protein
MSSLALTMQIDIRYVFLIEIAKLYDHRMHISVIGKGMNLEKVTLKKSVEALKSESHEKYREDPLFSSLKKQLDDDCTSEDERIDNATDCHFKLPSQDVKSSDQVSSCPFPYEFEETCGEMCGYPSPSGSPSNHMSVSLPKKEKSKNLGNSNKTKKANNMIGADLAIVDDTMRMFTTYWKEACCQHTVPQVFSFSCYRLYFPSVHCFILFI